MGGGWLEVEGKGSHAGIKIKQPEALPHQLPHTPTANSQRWEPNQSLRRSKKHHHHERVGISWEWRPLKNDYYLLPVCDPPPLTSSDYAHSQVGVNTVLFGKEALFSLVLLGFLVPGREQTWSELVKMTTGDFWFFLDGTK